MIECYGICSEKCTAMQDGKCVLDAKKAECANDFQLYKEDKENDDSMDNNSLRKEHSMDFEEIKKMIIDSIDESENLNDLIQIVIDKIYKKGFHDGYKADFPLCE